MKKLYIIFSLIFSLCVSVYAQPAVVWQKAFGYDLLIETGIRDIVRQSDGGYAVAGEFVPSSSYMSYYLARFDSAGNKLWERTYGGDRTRYTSIITTLDGGFLLGGYSDSDASGDKSENSRGDYDYWVIKVDSMGDKQWDKTLGGSQYDGLFSVSTVHDGGFVLAGYSNSGVSFDKTQPGMGAMDYWIVKLDASGNKVWDTTVGGLYNDMASIVRQTSDNRFIVVGTSQSPSGTKTLMVKLNGAGIELWSKDISQQVNKLIVTPDGGFLLAGSSGSQGWIGKVDANGNVEWEKTFSNVITTVERNTDGGYLLGARTGDYFLYKTDAEGNIEWEKAVGGSGTDIIYSAIELSSGTYIAAGMSYSGISGDRTVPYSDGPVWVVKLANVAKEGYVSASGWINSPAGAATHAPMATGKAYFSANVQYMPGTATPQGTVTFKFGAANLTLKNTQVSSMDITGTTAYLEGVGSYSLNNINYSNCNFSLSAVDGSMPGQLPMDKFRIRITSGGNVIYDNEMSAPVDAPATTPIGGIITVSNTNAAASSMVSIAAFDDIINAELGQGISIYPNPVQRDFQLGNLPEGGILDLRLTNLAGKTVAEFKRESQSNISLSLPASVSESGIYILSVMHDNNYLGHYRVKVER